MKKILLALQGKRIVAVKEVEPIDGSFDWVAKTYPDTETRTYKLIDHDDKQLELAKYPFSYYDAKTQKVKRMQTVSAEVDKTSIENNGEDYVIYTLKTNEQMDVIVQQEVGGKRENLILPLVPNADGIITLEIDSNALGTIRISALGDTKYAETIEVAVV